MFSTNRMAAKLVTNLVLCSILALPCIAKKPPRGGGGGGGSGGGTGSTAVQYRLTYLDAWGSDWETSAKDMNDLGTIVGSATNVNTGELRAVCWFPSGAILDLNEGATWTDANGGTAEGWTARYVRSVNMYDQMAGAASKPGFADRAFIYDLATASVLLLPAVTGQTDVGDKNIDINDDAVVVSRVEFGSISGGVVYAPPLYQPQFLPASVTGSWIRINNLGTITDQTGIVVFPGAQSYDYSQPQVLNLAATYRIWGLRDNADIFSGSRLASGKGKNSTPAGPVRVNLDSGASVQLASSGYGQDINEQNDALVRGISNRGYVYKQGEGLLTLDNEIVNADTSWQQASSIVVIALTNPNAITDPDATGHGAICGTRWATSTSGQRAFVLFPEDQP